jgi:hypothetical protein
MLYVNKITDDPDQQITLIGEAGQQISFNLYFDPTQNGWFADISWGTWQVTGFQILVGPNVWRQWKNIITFGLMVTSSDGYDPAYIEDFASGRIQLYLLNASDVQAVEAEFFE